jgi:Subtilase family
MQGTLLKTYPQLRSADGDYMRMSGTSMATAVTSGVVALMLEANRYANNYPYHPSLTPNAVKAMLQYSAFPVYNAAGLEYNPLEEGAGGDQRQGSNRTRQGCRHLRADRHALAHHDTGAVDEHWWQEHYVEAGRRLGLGGGVGQHRRHQPAGVGHGRRVGERQHHVWQRRRVGQQRRLDRSTVLGERGRLGQRLDRHDQR